MNLKQEPIEGKCRANRCKTDADQPGSDNPYGLCNQHYNEWQVLGRPDLQPPQPRKGGKGGKGSTAGAAAATAQGVNLETVKAELEPVRNNLERALAFVSTVPFEAEFPAGFAGRDPARGPMTGLEVLGHMRETARQQFAQIEEKRTSITKPLLAAKRAADEVFKPGLEGCEAIVKACTDRLTNYERARLEAQRAAAAQVQSAPSDPTLLAVAHHAPAPLPAEVRPQTIFTYKVTDLALVPREFMVLNDQLVRAYISHHRGQCEIPGLEIVQDVQVVAS